MYQVASDWLNLGEFIFVFDDLERCECPINELFGFLNELIEHENTKVIIIANEKEVSGIAEVQNLEGQYYLSLDERIEWPKQENCALWSNQYRNSTKLSLMKWRGGVNYFFRYKKPIAVIEQLGRNL
ncbi:P-loop NTPase fold protein [Blautia sp. OF03-13]|uniref:P-loop NTPase fold protein n=1 Tax=Blautia sp. OF03-13 TaxID=2292980 RepID=UPI000E48142E|nr:hypothetical protein DXA55_13250 [Blautia sp. OF03-13]